MEDCIPGLAVLPNGVHGGDAAAGAAAPQAVDLSGFSKQELTARYTIRPDLPLQGQPSYWEPQGKYFIYFVGSLQRWSICGSESYNEVVAGASLGWAFQLEAVPLTQTSHWLERVGEEWPVIVVTAIPFPPAPSRAPQAAPPAWASRAQPPPPPAPPPVALPPVSSKGGDWDTERGRTGRTGSSSSGTAWEQQQGNSSSGTAWEQHQGNSSSGTAWEQQQGNSTSGAAWEQQGNSSSGTAWEQQQGRDAGSAPADWATQEDRNVRARTGAGPHWADGAGAAAAAQGQTTSVYTPSGQEHQLAAGAGIAAAAQGQTTSGYTQSGQGYQTNSQDQNGERELLPVDWASLKLPPFRREFLPYACADPQEAHARRQELKIEVEEDPAGPSATPLPIRAFADLRCLPPWLHEALRENAWEFPLPIQAQALPILLGGKSLIGIAQTGSGKTASFLVPAVVHIEAQAPLNKQNPGPVVLVLAPTRELAVQISDEATKLCRFSSKSQQHWDGITSVVFYGGGKKWQQLRWFGDHGSHILVSTPGRLLDFMKDGMVSLQRVTYLVFDEADRMLDLGFADDMKEVSSQVRPQRQMAYFSATWPKAVQALACEFCNDAPVRVRVGGADADGREEENDMDGDGELAPNARNSIVQEVVVMDSDNGDWTALEEDKMSRIKQHVKQVFLEDSENKVLIFVNEKGQVDRLSNELWDQGYEADGIHSGRKQDMRLEVLERFRQGKVRVLVATDVIGRGLDIPKVSHVVIHSMGGVDDYVHRIGRTGRGKDGKGHALVFFEYYANRPNCAGGLIGVLERANQPVPADLRKIADDVASGERSSKWGSGGGRSWGSGGWKDGGNWRSSGGWKDNSWKDSSWKSGIWKETNRPEPSSSN